VDGEVVLARVRELPIERWSYRAEPGVRHLGTFAEDFHRAFGLGPGETTIGMIDMDGVNLAAVQALERRTQNLQARLAEQDDEIRLLRTQLADLLGRLERLERASGR
jgi:trimeric autotransporter adhesin